MRIKFQHSLDELKGRLLVMAGLAEQAIERSVAGYATRDAAMCNLVIHSEPAINQLEREIDHMAGDLLATEQPMAVDLRFILAVLRINGDLERVGDQAVNIARRSQEMMDMPQVEMPVDIPRLGSLAGAMVRSALQSFIEGDTGLAQSVLLLDDQVDAMNSAAFKSLSGLIEQQPDVTSQALNALIIAKNLERIGDHATNIAEDVIFWVLGADVRHGVAINPVLENHAA
jgi:phosphate transport system protein